MAAKSNSSTPTADEAKPVEPATIAAPPPVAELAVSSLPKLMGPPTSAEWELLEHQAVTLSKSELVPKNLRSKPQDIIVIALQARELRIPMMFAMSRLHVIEGTPSMAAELMVALVQRDGHRLEPGRCDAETATAIGQRKGSPTSVEVTYTIDNARAAGLLDVWWERWCEEGGRKWKETFTHPELVTKWPPRMPADDDVPDWVKKQGARRAKRKDNWWSYTSDMLWARAVSRLCRRLFADVLMGASLTPEELGAEVDPLTGEISYEVEVASPETIEGLRARARALPDVLQSQLRQWFAEFHVPPIPRLPARYVQAVDDQIAGLEQWADTFGDQPRNLKAAIAATSTADEPRNVPTPDTAAMLTEGLIAVGVAWLCRAGAGEPADDVPASAAAADESEVVKPDDVSTPPQSLDAVTHTLQKYEALTADGQRWVDEQMDRAGLRWGDADENVSKREAIAALVDGAPVSAPQDASGSTEADPDAEPPTATSAPPTPKRGGSGGSGKSGSAPGRRASAKPA